jgi:hypothetical protein
MARIDGLRNEERFSHFMQAWDLYPLLKARGFMRVESRLTDEGGQCGINGVRIVILSKEEARADAQRRGVNFAHRVLAECDCGRLVPFGKLGQHRKACSANVFQQGEE